jgi:hypothetical protein
MFIEKHIDDSFGGISFPFLGQRILALRHNSTRPNNLKTIGSIASGKVNRRSEPRLHSIRAVAAKSTKGDFHTLDNGRDEP